MQYRISTRSQISTILNEKPSLMGLRKEPKMRLKGNGSMLRRKEKSY
ncbi:hypothetical protein EMIT0158MI4_10621 [Burkholderia ambifaria]